MPLAFTRRAESGYTAGRWFGPSWSSTVDEHHGSGGRSSWFDQGAGEVENALLTHPGQGTVDELSGLPKDPGKLQVSLQPYDDARNGNAI